MAFSVPSATDIATDPTGFWRPPVTKIDDLVIDVLTHEDPQHDVDVTVHPVETNEDIADHIVQKPTVLLLEGVLADPDLSPSAVGAALLSGGKVLQTWEDKHRKLIEIKNKTKPFTIITPLDEYYNMVMTSLRTTRTKDTGEALIFSATFQHIRTVSTYTSFVDAEELPVSKATNVKKENKPATKSADTGLKAAEPASDPASSRTDALNLSGWQ